ncbi:RNA polymerase sigma factor [Niabella aquatica]
MTLLKTNVYNELDRVSFCRLYKDYQQVLFRKLLLLIDSQEVVKDIVQDVFMKIWVRRKCIKADASLKTYMYRIGHNMIVDHYRSLGRKQRFAFTTFSDNHTDNNTMFPEDCLVEIEEVVSKLPPKRKRVFELCKLEQKSYEEAGEILHVSPSTISDHIVKAKQFIRSELFKQGYPV